MTIAIPDNATNGDVIKALFPNADISFRTEYRNYEVVYVRTDEFGASWKIRAEWWNEPYRRA